MFKFLPITFANSIFVYGLAALLSTAPVHAQTKGKKVEQVAPELKTYKAQGVSFRAKFPRKFEFQNEYEFERDKVKFKKTSYSVSNPDLKDGDDYQIYQIAIDVERPIAPALDLSGREEQIISALIDNYKRIYGKSYVVEKLSPIEKAANGKWMVQKMSGINRVADFATIMQVYVMSHYIVRVHLYYTPKKEAKAVVDAFIKEFELLDVEEN